jgi:hypothetical protein
MNGAKARCSYRQPRTHLPAFQATGAIQMSGLRKPVLVPALLVLIAGFARSASAVDNPDIPDADGLFPNKPGEWAYAPNTAKVSAVRLGATAARDLAAKMEGIMTELAASPVFHPPLGFQAKARTQYNGRVCADPGGSSGMCAEGPADASNDITFYYFLDEGDGKASWGGEANSSVRVSINGLAGALGGPGAPADGSALLPDGRQIVLCPKKVGDLDGVPLLESVHGSWSMTIARPGLPLWLPVSRQEYLAALIRALEKSLPAIKADMTNTQDPYAAWLAERPQREKGIRDSYEAMKKTDAAQAEQFLEMSERMDAATGEQLKAMRTTSVDTGGLRPMEAAIETFKEEIARMSEEDRELPAYYVHPDESRDGPFGSGLVPEGTPDAIQLVAVNPELVDRSRPPEEIQLITVSPIFDGSRVSNARLDEFLRTVQWSRVASFVR